MTNIVEEWVDCAYTQLKDEEARHISVVKSLVMAENRIKELNTKLTKADRERKSEEATLAGAKKQAEDQCQQLRKAEEQLVIAREQIGAQKKELENNGEVVAQAE